MHRFFDTVGKRIRVLRQDVGYNQQELAAEVARYGASVKPSYISALETTGKVPSVQVLMALAQALGTTTDYLLMLSDDPVPPGEDEAEPVKALREEPESYEVNELLNLLNAMPAEDVDHLLYVARLMRDARAPRIVE